MSVCAMASMLERYLLKEDPLVLKVIENVRDEEKLNVDEYTKFKKPPTALQSFYAGKSIFLTGSTGFMGKCFVEKVLRDCSDLKKLYVLVRSKVGLTAQEKMKKYFNNTIFDRVRKINPNFEDKVQVVRGDLYEKGLGLSAEDRQLLIDNVDIMVHNGATVRFNESVSGALRINVLGTKEMLELAMACKHMHTFMYVSTAYSHCYQTHIREEFYEPPADLKVIHDLIAADEAFKNGMPEGEVQAILGKWPNIYTFSKSMSEDLVRQYGERANFACGVYRPSMVFGAMKEPRIGWIGNRNGPIIGFIACALGIIHGALYRDGSMDIVPVDYCINSLLAAAYHMTKEWEHEKKPRVYNFGSSDANQATLPRLFTLFRGYASTVGSVNSVWIPSMMFPRQKWMFYLIHFFLHFIPAIFADIVLLVMRQKPRALSICWTATKNLPWMLHFISRGWRIQVTETRKAYEYLSEEDRKVFDFDIWRMSWQKFIAINMIGSRIYGINEPLNNLPAARRHFFKMTIVHYVTLTIFYLLLVYLVVRLYNSISFF